MQTVSQLFEDICSTPNYTTRVRATVDDTVYTMSELISLSRSVQSMESVSKLIGNAMAGTAKVTFIPSSPVPTAAEVKIEICVTDGTDTSEWIEHGTFYVSKRYRSEFGSGDAIELVCYDSMCKADSQYASQTLFSEWPQTDIDVADEIATIIGTELDERTDLAGYSVPYPGEYTMREILQYIAVSNCGNWIITPDNKLLFIKINDTSAFESFDIGLSVSDYTDLGQSDAYSGIHLYYGDENSFVVGDDTGYVLETDCPWGTQSIAEDMFDILDGYEHQGFEGNGAFIQPYAELGDVVTIDDVSYTMAQLDVDYGSVYRPAIGSPGPDDVENEYPYLSPIQRDMKRTVKVGQDYYGTSISHGNGITVERTDGGQTYNNININSDRFVAVDSSGNPVMEMDFVSQTFKWFGDLNIVDGSISLEKLGSDVTNFVTSTVDGLQTTVSQTYMPLGEYDGQPYEGTAGDLKTTLESQIKQTADNIDIQFTNITEDISDLNTATEANADAIENVTSHIVIGPATMTFKVDGADYELTITNTGITITGPGGDSIAEFTATGVLLPAETTIPQGGTFRMGNFQWSPRSSGNLSMIYVGS